TLVAGTGFKRKTPLMAFTKSNDQIRLKAFSQRLQNFSRNTPDHWQQCSTNCVFCVVVFCQPVRSQPGGVDGASGKGCKSGNQYSGHKRPAAVQMLKPGYSVPDSGYRKQRIWAKNSRR